MHFRSELSLYLNIAPGVVVWHCPISNHEVWHVASCACQACRFQIAHVTRMRSRTLQNFENPTLNLGFLALVRFNLRAEELFEASITIRPL